jgi:hypothetical protein
VDVNLASWLVVAVAVAAANLPFVNERLFALVAIPRKPFWVRLVELFTLYLATGALAYALESSIGGAFAQGWEFYAVTWFLFMVLAFPGFVLRYLRKHH